mmetsp:Transcript_12698/g.23034  ORF Transcript_12698/g.23034 Transcript_12698/m.23034 type:complete len:178 (-) Transcript_12698:147-680(-)|eukprot:CAMPEP_0197528916 /NCGR_PEP_ID=MMETSP1318-20131121/26754_1 /TAXON_ID=552666 /ORGANISM="Partenskyella glossopodia, Strain RCC365" /LENGTH=177 /DNA_ID=CAMNT_0043084203 /DNA_START=31 /DNA_END=564 /DNA_ORIENTATION=-
MEEEKPAYGGGETETLLTAEDRSPPAAEPRAAAKASNSKGLERRCTSLLILHWVGLIFCCGYFGYAAGMLFGVAHYGPTSLRVCVTYSYMMIFSFILMLGEFRIESVLSRFRFLSTPFGLGTYYLFLAFFALIDDVAWWKWVLFCPMAGMFGAYIVAGACQHDISNDLVDIEGDKNA